METRDGRSKQDTERPVGCSGESGRNTKEMIKNGRSMGNTWKFKGRYKEIWDRKVGGDTRKLEEDTGKSREIWVGKFRGDIWKFMGDTGTAEERQENWCGKLRRDIENFVKATGRVYGDSGIPVGDLEASIMKNLRKV
jgi:hypothetical protein